METKKLIVFDLDGTLNRTELFGVEVHRMVQTEFGWNAQTPEEITATYGAPASEYISALLPGADKDTQRRYLDRVSEVERDYMHLAASYDGCAELMDILHGLGWKTAVCSNSSHRYISMILTNIGLLDKIDYIRPLDKTLGTKGKSLKLLLDELKPETAVMVGDTNYDRDAAEENSLPFIGCRYGFRPLEMEDVTVTVGTPLEIADVIQKL